MLVESKLTHLKASKNGSLVGVRNITLLWLLKGLSLKKKNPSKKEQLNLAALSCFFLVKANQTTKVKITENLTWTWMMLHVVHACDFQISWWSIKLIRKYKHSGSRAAKGFFILIVYVNISILSCPLVLIRWWYSVWPWRRQIMCRPAELLAVHLSPWGSLIRFRVVRVSSGSISYANLLIKEYTKNTASTWKLIVDYSVLIIAGVRGADTSFCWNLKVALWRLLRRKWLWSSVHMLCNCPWPVLQVSSFSEFMDWLVGLLL